jgi:hypothetical protein
MADKLLTGGVLGLGVIALGMVAISALSPKLDVQPLALERATVGESSLPLAFVRMNASTLTSCTAPVHGAVYVDESAKAQQKPTLHSL